MQMLQNIKVKTEKIYHVIEPKVKAERIIACILVLTPFVLWLADDGPNLRDSISNYVYMRHSYWYGSLLALAGAMFIFNGAIHLQPQHATQHTIKKVGKGYNIILGISLFGVIYFPHLDYPIWHYTFAILFFLGSAIITAFVSNEKREWTRYVLAVAVVLPVVLALDFIGLFSLFWGEAISLFFIATHYLLESK
jgi:cytochrome c oxidase subunit IV